MDQSLQLRAVGKNLGLMVLRAKVIIEDVELVCMKINELKRRFMRGIMWYEVRCSYDNAKLGVTCAESESRRTDH